MTYVAYKRGTLLVPSGPSGMHLFVVLTNKCANGFHLLVSVTSIKEGRDHDTACVFAGGEHPFVKQPSYAYYRLTEQKHHTAITSSVERGYFVPKDDMPVAPFDAMCGGLMQSDFVGPWAVQYYLKNKDN